MRRSWIGTFGAVLSLLVAGSLYGQSILTVAGGVIGDDRPATRASIILPTDVVVDGDGNVFIADTSQYRVRRIDARTGIITTIAGNGLTEFNGEGGPATRASFQFPVGIAVDSEGNVFIASEQNRVLRVDSATGILTTVAGTGERGFGGDGGPATEALLAGPSAVAVDSAGNLYIADRLNDRVRRVDAATGIIMTIAGTGAQGFSGDGGLATDARLDFSGDGFGINSGDVELDTAGNLYIADTMNQRVRRVDVSTGIITTIAGGGGGGDGVPATETRLTPPVDIAIDPSGNLFIAQPFEDSLRRVDGVTGIITTIAGGSASGFAGDGGPATEAVFDSLNSVAVDSDGNLYIADEQNNRIRKVDASTSIVETIAGGFVGDGLVATEASFTSPDAVVVGPDEALYISDVTAHRVRRVDPTTRVIDTIAGNGIPDFSGDGGPATEASLSFPGPVTIDSRGNLYIGDLENIRIRRVDPNGTITTYAGGGSSTADGILAVNASIGFTFGLDVDALDNLYMAIIDDQKVRKVDVATGIITTVAGTGAEGFSGDGGPATEARLNYPTDVAVDEMGNIYIADFENNRIRRVDAATGIITTILESPAQYLKADAKGFLYINEGLRIKRMDLASGEVVPLAGSGVFGYSGDGGPALEADMEPTGIHTDREGNLFIGDRGRIRAVFRCVEIMRAEPQSPDPDAFLSSLAPVLRWSAVEGAFSYDVYLDTDPSASALAAADVAGTRLVLSNLQPETTYHWRVVAKGDPYCTLFSEVSSVTRAFRTPPSCAPPRAPVLIAPAAGSSISGETIDLRWERSAGATQYDVFLGTTTPPPFFRSTRGTSIELIALVPGQTYYWSVVARAGCDRAITASSSVSSFVVPGECGPTAMPAIVSPSDGTSEAPLGLDLEWSPSTGASSYDLFLGTSDEPPLATHMGNSTSAKISGLLPGTRYFWRVRANVDCDASLSQISSVVSFVTTDECPTPEPVAFSSTATTVGFGRTYVLEWEGAEGLGPLGSYLVERATDSSFQMIVDSQRTQETSATFVADREGTIHHRVRPVSGCDPSIETAFSPIRAFDVVFGEEPNVIFTVEPKSVVLSPGERLEDLHETFVLENITEEPVEVSVTSARIDSVPFFTIRDPLGGDPESITLEPREPKSLELRFSGPPNDVVASYQGLIIVGTPDSPVASYAYVNLKIGDQGGAAPEIRFDGAPTAFAFFPGFAGDDASRPPITIEVHNPGSTPMDLSAEIGPEIWLEPESGWNSTPIPAGGTRTMRLFTRRKLAPNGSALPRYTFLTLRTRAGESARLLVQDNEGLDTSRGRPAALEPDVRTIIVPEIVSGDSADRLISKVSLTNVSADDVQADLIFTPEGADGFGESSVRSTVIVPANDVVVITDPLRQVFALDPPSRGQLEVRESAGSIGLLRVQSSIVRAGDVQNSLVVVPTVFRGDGARSDFRHRIAGISSSAEESTTLIAAETSGLDGVAVRVSLYDETGALAGEEDVSLSRYGYAPVSDLIPDGFTVGWAELTVLEGDGAAVGLAKILDVSGRRGSVLLSEPSGDEVGPAKRHRVSGGTDSSESVTSVLVAPYVAKGKIKSDGADWRTVMGFAAPPGGLEFSVTFTGSDGTSLERKVTIPASSLAGAVVELNDVLGQLFGIEESASGSITVTGDSSGKVYGRLVSGNLPAGTIELVSTISESVSSLQSRRPLYVDGLEQSTDPDRGTRWSLHVKEVGGQGGTVGVRLYEAGNRTSPIAEKTFSVSALQQLSLESLFGEMGLDSDARRKDRTNVLLVLTPESGGAGIVATAVEIDNRTGAPTTHALKPLNGGLGGGGSTLLAKPIVPEVDEPGRQRPVRRKN